jgi:Spy/CpxP family protein refolding chaperone
MKTVILGATVAIFLLASSAGSQPRMGMMMDELGLSHQQVQQLETLMIQHQKEMVKERADLKMARLELKEIMMKDSIDEKAALAKQDKISSVKAEIARMNLRHKIAAQKILTAEQLSKWRLLKRGMGRHDRFDNDHWKGMRQMMKHGQMGPGMMGPGSQTPPDDEED